MSEQQYEIVWKDKKGQYESGKNAFVGKIKIGSYSWNGVDRNPELKWVPSFSLPGVRITTPKVETEERAMHLVKMAFKLWLELLNKSGDSN